MNGALRRLAPIVLAGVLLVAAWLAAALSAPQINNVPVPRLRPVGSARPSTVEPTATDGASAAPTEQTEIEQPDERTGLVTVLVLAGFLAAGGVAGWVLVRRRVRATATNPLVVARPGAARPPRRPDQVVAAVDAGLSELSDADADPRRAVIACWLRLERAAADAGTPRHPGDSPTDLVGRLLADHQVSPAALDDLAAVYREARYAKHTIDEAMRAAASGALGQVRAELGRQVPDQRRQDLDPAGAGGGAGAAGNGAGSTGGLR